MRRRRRRTGWREIDLARRAQIGRDRSARTRAELIAAARTLYAARPFDQVTVDDVVAAAGVAKGTFYVHFDSLADLQSVVADDLAREFDEFLQPRRLALDDPIERIAAGCGAFILQTLHDPAWGMLVARGAAAMPHVAGVARKRLKEDIDRAARDGHLGGVTPELAFDFATRHHAAHDAVGTAETALAAASVGHRCRHSSRDRRCGQVSRNGGAASDRPGARLARRSSDQRKQRHGGQSGALYV